MVWLIHPLPRQDELLSSWLTRIAVLHGIRPHTFGKIFWPKLSIWSQDIDVFVPPGLLELLSRETGTTLERSRQTTLIELEGKAFENCFAHGRSANILPVTSRGRQHRGWGQQFCPLCLLEEGVFRRSWRLVWATCCSLHAVDLQDACSGCGAPVTPYRLSGFHCSHCHSPIYAPPVPVSSSRRLAFQHLLEEALSTGWGSFGGEEDGWPSVIFFDVLRQLMKLVAVGARSQRFRNAVASFCGADAKPPAFGGAAHDIETLRQDDRARIIEMVAEVTTDWPERLVEACQAAGLWRSWILQDWSEPRFPLVQIAEGRLRPPRTAFESGQRRPEFHRNLSHEFWDKHLR